MKEAKNDDRKKLVIEAIAVAVMVGIIALVIFALTYKREEFIYEADSGGDASALVCTSNNNDSEVAFFSSDDVSSVEHKIKLIYRSGIINKLSYEFLGKYDSEEAAKEAKGVFNTKYNIYIGDHGMELDVLSPVFQYIGNKAKVELYLDSYKKMNSAIGKLFYISSASLDSVAKNSKEETKKYYEKKGFSCIISD